MSKWYFGLVALWGCPMSDAVEQPADAGLAPTHSALISIQDFSLAGSDDHALSVQALFNAARRPDYEEKPGQPDGCKAWFYDLTREQPPAPEDHGVLTISGLRVGTQRCPFAPGRGNVCPGAGPSQDTPFTGVVHVELEPGGGNAFVLPPADIVPGEAFTLDAASRQAITDLPFQDAELALDCAECGAATVSIVRITTTDAVPAGATDMPTPLRRYVELSCANVAGTAVHIPAPALALLLRAHAESPFTRIRTAYMRDGFAQLVNAPPGPPNRAIIAVGHGVIGYSDLR